MEKAVSLFVYGSLMRGLKHHDQMDGAQFVRTAQLWDHHLVLYQAAYPALVAGLPNTKKNSTPAVVQGELFFLVGSEHLARLDLFEECPQLYQRSSVVLNDGTSTQTYMIGANAALSYEEIPGDYRSYLKGSYAQGA